jgi:hypothetical protein
VSLCAAPASADPLTSRDAAIERQRAAHEREVRLLREARDELIATVGTIAGEDDIALEREGDESEHAATIIHDAVARDLKKRHPGQDPQITRLDVIPPLYGEPESVGLAFVHYEGLRDETGQFYNFGFTDVVAYRMAGDRFRPLGLVDVWGFEPREWRRTAAAVEFTTTTQRDSDPNCCWTGRTRYRVDLRTLTVEVLGYDG